MTTSMDNNNRIISEDLNATRKAVLEKYFELKREELAKEQFLKPITGPLEKLLARGPLHGERQKQETTGQLSPKTDRAVVKTEKLSFGNKRAVPKLSLKRHLPPLKAPKNRGVSSARKFKTSTPKGPFKSTMAPDQTTIDATDVNDWEDSDESSRVEPTFVSSRTMTSPVTTIAAQDEQEEEEEEEDVGGEEIYEHDPTYVPSAVAREKTDLFKEKLGHIAGPYFKLYFEQDAGVDKTYGVRSEGGSFKIGNKTVQVHLNDLIVGEDEYEGTPGLYELIFMTRPDMSKVKPQDKENYVNILQSSSVVRRGHAPSSQIKGNSGLKYTRIIKPLLKEAETRWRLGNKSGESYKYWNDVNTLVDRLHLLHASTHAGHTSHANEILFIEKELRDAHIIV